MDFSPDSIDLTLDEVEEIEELVDVPAAQWGECKQGKLLKAMVLTVRRRKDPKAKLEDVGKLHISELEAELNPTAGGGTPAS